MSCVSCRLTGQQRDDLITCSQPEQGKEGTAATTPVAGLARFISLVPATGLQAPPKVQQEH